MRYDLGGEQLRSMPTDFVTHNYTGKPSNNYFQNFDYSLKEEAPNS